jgi:hypothetical protein
VPLQAEAWWGRDAAAAAFHLEDAVAGPTVEVVVVLLAGHLEAVGLAGKGHRDEPAFTLQAAQVAVDGGEAEVGGVGAGLIQHLGRGEGAVRTFEGGADGAALPRVPFHGRDSSASAALLLVRMQMH